MLLKYVVLLGFRITVHIGVSKFTLDARHKVMGSALHVPLSPGIAADSTVKVTISYRTTKGSTALQWLAKEYILVDPLIHQYNHAECPTGRLKEGNSRICSANVNRYMREPWHHYRVRIIL